MVEFVNQADFGEKNAMGNVCTFSPNLVPICSVESKPQKSVTKAKDNSAHMHMFQHCLPHTIPDVYFNMYHHCPCTTCTLYIKFYSNSLLYNVVAKILENVLGASIDSQ